ncbi:MAG: potassium transporter Kup [Gemmatimonadetes bacterium]|nr:potassium transporter Kup [Gemmatimonadota bacterium]
MLSLGALGVVYGDIGTSPLYALHQCFAVLPPTRDNLLGVLSLVFWSLTALISIWYLAVVMRADNRGEGGILALAALFGSLRDLKPGQRRPLYMVLGIFGAALLYGDGMITPAISVLGAVEGLEVAAPGLRHAVVPIVAVILIGLFAVQRYGTGRVGSMFGPITLLWFLVIGLLGLVSLAREPAILGAINPAHAVRFFRANGFPGFVVLGSVFLVVTGGEALFADMGHFGRRPIRLAWYGLVLPALLLNYFGQGALLLRDPGAVRNPFYLLAPEWGRYPLIVLATAAAVIASQAVISGSFSLTRQAVQLGLSPRLTVVHTSAREIGQIYVPAINWTLLISSIALVFGFGSSSRLGAAYGVAVTMTMAITTILTHRVMTRLWAWNLLAATLMTAVFLSMDLAFLGANALKVLHGGWVPLVVGLAGYLLLTTWQRGRQVLQQRLSEITVPLPLLLGDIAADPPTRVPGTAIFMTAQPDGVPYTLLHNLRHNHVLHQRVIFLTLRSYEIPRVPEHERVTVEPIEEGFYRVTGHYGFMEEPDVLEVIEKCRAQGLDIVEEATSFFVGRETLLATDRPGMPIWREKLFSLMSRNTPRITTSFNVPAEQVIEIGAQIEL